MLIEMAQKEFYSEKKFEGLTKNSLECYEIFFKSWNEWLVEEKIEHVDELSPRVVKKYMAYCLDERNNKPTSVNSKLKMLRTFARWLHSEKITKEVFTENIKTMRQDVEPKMVRDEDIQHAIHHLRRAKRRENTFESRRNYTMLLFMIGTGMRLSEIEQLDWNDIDLNGYLITIGKSKSRKTQSIPLSETLAKELLDWRYYIENKFGEVPTPVFVTKTKTRLTKNGIQLFFKRLKKNLGIQGDFSAHCMRNVYIKNLLKNGANLREVQLLARHSKIEVTRQYVGYFAHELKDALERHNPLRDLL
ncbi:tyrosine-type recombinase/integrase [Anaerobacillus isosaccharinicus]|uniref:Tyrosine-type recombinase/integrase n=1 Tax=Anaerobacillus isosaccharinicus TaxID=1532552 RepID=A0A1S2M3G0_9BACI|nr:tyrosine-type recombinase/integrase [Anaerobacillus isosaccharinicus]MBA5587595.1 tyrosine-type recombinase/integrase [Anaerobacillus isosaccharinicus]QOY34229.1 tyrosine-type recombinase/integrase [Anaerobacillus isosaccharinicus]